MTRICSGSSPAQQYSMAGHESRCASQPRGLSPASFPAMLTRGCRLRVYFPVFVMEEASVLLLFVAALHFLGRYC